MRTTLFSKARLDGDPLLGHRGSPPCERDAWATLSLALGADDLGGRLPAALFVPPFDPEVTSQETIEPKAPKPRQAITRSRQAAVGLLKHSEAVGTVDTGALQAAWTGGPL
ncbi:hypothetical protein IscW_ISCW000989 [Ixodes scapularis]|uniref:Uncharacterized protein n=1 Tax=Ixodes scapularis TaxID=6945 RepID=B7P2X2_IXOSC|nr:hypothetical protein IscW_ISCW000989 [Ixodes scapularis]|eukprot:XP_002403096.1 hypothetical protein IscW_ISCW000989 [Ixodes scapularis]